jgi:hypothetical protein
VGTLIVRQRPIRLLRISDVTHQKRRKWALEVAGRSYWAREKITKDIHHFEKWPKVSIDRAGRY